MGVNDPAHVRPADDDRSKFEKEMGLWYCRRCGRLLESVKKGPAVGADKPCQKVGISLR